MEGQGLIQSTVRQVYDLHVGDSLEYKSDHRNVSGYTELMSHTIRVVLSRQDIGDSIILRIKDKTISSILYYGPNWGDSAEYESIYSHLDSSILYYHTATLGCDTHNFFCHIDTAYVDSSRYNSRKIDEHWEGNRSVAAYDTMFADGLGMISGSFGSEDNTIEQGGFTLEYYHLANGEVWGIPEYFRLPNGINDQDNSAMVVSVFPNPALSVFQIKLASFPVTKTTLYLHDEMGRMIRQQEISKENTQVDREGIADGVYFWTIRAEGMDIHYGKLVFE